jgi:hypothetical protein
MNNLFANVDGDTKISLHEKLFDPQAIQTS